jgi:hypothetical protein
VRPLDLPALARRYGSLAQLKDLEPRLRCMAEHCRAKGGQFFVSDEAAHRIAPYL